MSLLLLASLELLSATLLTLTLPLRISLVVARIDDQLSNVVNGIPSRSQKVTRSREWSVTCVPMSTKQERRTLSSSGEEEIGFSGRTEIRDTVSCVQQGRTDVIGQLSVGSDVDGFVVAKVTSQFVSTCILHALRPTSQLAS